MRAALRGWPSRGLLLLASVGVALAAAELLVRAFYADETRTERLREVAERVAIAAFTRESDVPGLLYELRPGTRMEWLGVPLVIDPEEPRRVAEEPLAEPPDALRIALLGDSTAFGWGVRYADSYGELLRRRLEETSGRPVVLRNYAVPGYNSHHNRVTLAERVLPWKPHLVLLHYDHNDADPIQSEPHGYMEPEFGDNALHSALLKLLRRRLYAWRHAGLTSSASQDPGNPDRFLYAYRYAGPQYDRSLEELRQLHDLAAAHGIPVLVLIFNAWLRATQDPASDPWYRLLHAPLMQRLTRMGFAVVDLYGPAQILMAERGWSDLRPLWLSPSDPHPRPAGHRFLAEVLERGIAAQPHLARLLRDPQLQNSSMAY
jgi:lysophospholipase L1-like esterase